MNDKKQPISVIFTLAIALLFSNAYAQKYDSEKTKNIIQKMIQAHGGMNKWKNAPTVSFTHDMLIPQNPKDRWISEEVHEQGTRRSYHKWPKDNALLADTGDKVWTVGWKRANPPKMMAGVSYFFLNLPWITQDKGAKLKLQQSEKVPQIAGDNEYHTVRLTFEGASPYEYYELYIDKKDFMLKGVEYTIVDQDLFKTFKLPADTKYMGPCLKVYNEYTNVGGLKFTTDYDAYFLPQDLLMGKHYVTNYDITRSFDEKNLKMPENGQVYVGNK